MKNGSQLLIFGPPASIFSSCIHNLFLLLNKEPFPDHATDPIIPQEIAE